MLDQRLHALFQAEGLLRARIVAEPDGRVVEEERAPLILLGPDDDDAYLPPVHQRQAIQASRLSK